MDDNDWSDVKRLTYDDLFEQTDISWKMMTQRLRDVLCIAPWTGLDLYREFEI